MKRNDDFDGSAVSLAGLRPEVQKLLARGWQVVRLRGGTKMAFEKDWPNRDPQPDDFEDGENLGVRFGPRSGGLCDIDLDYPSARALVGRPVFGLDHLPEFGRASLSPGKRGHRLVVCPDAPNRSRVFGIRSKEAKEALAARGVRLTVVEIRGSNGSQTAVPPSAIAGKGAEDALVWTDGDVGNVAVPELSWEELNRRVGLLAFASLCAAIYPEEDKARAEFEQHFLGALAEAGVRDQTATDMLVEVAQVAGYMLDPIFARLERDDVNVESLLAFASLPMLDHIVRPWLGIGAGAVEGERVDVLPRQARAALESDFGAGIISALQLQKLLNALDPADFPGYFDHLAVVLAAHHATGASPVAREVVVEWSGRNPEYGADISDEHGKPWSHHVRAAWDHARLDRPNPITLGTILHHLWRAGASDVALDATRQLAEVLEADDEAVANGATVSAVAWPRKLRYREKQNSARHGRVFRTARPAPLVTSDEVFFSLRQDGVWSEISEEALRAEIRATNPTDSLGVGDIAGMVTAVRDLSYTAARPFEWIEGPEDAPAPRDLVLFRNGLLDLRNDSLRPLDGAYFATGLPGVAYDPNADCPQWMKWLADRLDASFHPTLQEWFGYVMVPDTTAHRFMTFTGPPRSGKSTAKNVLENLVGSDHIARKQLSDLGNQFGLQDALDKRLIVIPDSKDVPGSQRGQALERLLALTGGDTVGIPRKFMESVSVKLLTRLLVLGNRQPAWIDESGAMAARQIAINFDRSFEGKEDQRVEDRLMSELAGIANWSIEGLRRLRANGYKFTVGEHGKSAVEDVRRSTSPALRFADDRLVVTGDWNDAVLQDEVYEAYRQWALDEGLSGRAWRNKTELMTDLETSLHNVKATQTRKLSPPADWDGGEYRPRALLGVRSVKLAPEHVGEF